MRHYTNALDAEAAAEVTLADVQDMPRTSGGRMGLAPIVVPADPWLDPSIADDEPPF